MDSLTVIKQTEQFIQLQNNIELAVKESKGIIIFEESDVDKAGFYIKKFKQLGKSIEDYRKEIVKPLNDQTKEILEFIK